MCAGNALWIINQPNDTDHLSDIMRRILPELQSDAHCPIWHDERGIATCIERCVDLFYNRDCHHQCPCPHGGSLVSFESSFRSLAISRIVSRSMMNDSLPSSWSC